MKFSWKSAPRNNRQSVSFGRGGTLNRMKDCFVTSLTLRNTALPARTGTCNSLCNHAVDGVTQLRLKDIVNGSIGQIAYEFLFVFRYNYGHWKSNVNDAKMRHRFMSPNPCEQCNLLQEKTKMFLPRRMSISPDWMMIFPPYLVEMHHGDYRVNKNRNWKLIRVTSSRFQPTCIRLSYR